MTLEVADVAEAVMPARLQLIGLCALLRGKYRGVDLCQEVLFLHQQLRYRCSLAAGDFLHLALIEIAVRGGAVHLLAFGGKLLDQGSDRWFFCIPHGADLLPLRVVQVQLMRNVAERAGTRPAVMPPSMTAPA